MRSALGNSLNVPAVKMLREVGLDPFCRMLSDVSLIQSPSTAGEYHGLGLAIGNLEVSLFQLVQAYGVFAADGHFRPLTTRKQAPPECVKKVLSKETAYIITHILADPAARMITFGNPGYFSFGFPLALKTGTSTNFRDSWIVAYTSEHVVGIWAGNFDGRSIGFSSGAGACGPILQDIVRFLYGASPPRRFQEPPGVKELRVCSMSGMPASALCPHTSKELVVLGKETRACDMDHERDHHVLTADYAGWLAHREARQGRGRFRLSTETVHTDAGRVDHVAVPIEITSPHDEDHFVPSPHRSNVIRFQARTRRLVEHVAWFIDGIEVSRTGPPYEFFWNPQRGKHVVLAVTPWHEAARLEITVE